MSNITYATGKNGVIEVSLGKTKVGKIINSAGTGWIYIPKGQTTGGDVYPSLIAVKRSLEEE